MRTLLHATFAATLLVPLPALSQDLPWRATLRFADVHAHDSSNQVAGSSSTLTAEPSSAIEIALGYRFAPMWVANVSLMKAGLDVAAQSPGMSSVALGDADLLITALTMQYHFFVTGRLQPYVGAGAHLASFSGVTPSSSLNDSGLAGFTLDDSLSVSLELGVSFDLSERLAIDVNAAFHDVATDVEFLLADGAPWSRARLDIDPWKLAAGVTVRF